MSEVPSLPTALAEALDDHIRFLMSICPVGGSARVSASITVVTRANGQCSIGLRFRNARSRVAFKMRGPQK